MKKQKGYDFDQKIASQLLRLGIEKIEIDCKETGRFSFTKDGKNYLVFSN